ncbi:MAG TPA: HAD-IIIA family hydrolase [Chryseolinea sp.]|nr:HAD-IIIA family hydrolase [Chryseolinea sp.]
MKAILENYSKDLVRKASTIKAIFMDVDGVLTDGQIVYGDDGRELKNFHVRDGLIVSHLKRFGIITGIISGRESAAVSKRCAELQIDFCHQGILDKLSVVEKLTKHYGLKMKEVMYIGDDINDVAVFRKCGLSVGPADTLPYLKDEVDLVSRYKGGRGVMREAADLVLAARGFMDKLL